MKGSPKAAIVLGQISFLLAKLVLLTRLPTLLPQPHTAGQCDYYCGFFKPIRQILL